MNEWETLPEIILLENIDILFRIYIKRATNQIFIVLYHFLCCIQPSVKYIISGTIAFRFFGCDDTAAFDLLISHV